MTTTETLKLALEALETGGWNKTTAAITALREALASQGEALTSVPDWASEAIEQKSGIKQVIELYDSPEQPAQAEVPLYGEPLANQELNCVCGAVWQGDELVHLPRKPASKPWVGLTDEDKKTPDMGKYVFLNDDWIDGYKTGLEKAEAKLKEKNNGN